MAELRFERATRDLPGRRRAAAVDDARPRDRRRRADGARRPVGLGQDDGAAHARRARGGLRGHDLHRRPGRHDLEPPKDRDVAMVFQNYALYPYLDVAANIAFPLKMAKVPKARARAAGARGRRDARARRSTLERKPAQLSGGQRQRVAMGRAIVREPKAFLMDEPLSNLDAKLRVAMRADIAALQHRLGVTTVYVTHDQVEAMTMGHRVAVLRDGRLQQCDTPRELYDRPAQPLRRRLHRLAGDEPLGRPRWPTARRARRRPGRARGRGGARRRRARPR